MEFKYETHLHTCFSSACGKSSGKEHVRYYKDMGYTGIFVTDHFYGGNTAIPRNLPWREWVNQYCAGYEDALEEGLRIGLDVFFAWEETFHGDDYLVYGLDKEWLLEHPEVRTWTRKEQYEIIHQAGGAVIQAHPFRNRDYIERILLNRKWIDGIESANAGNDPVNDVYARNYGAQYGLYQIAGSDNHLSVPGCNVYGIATNTKLTGARDWAQRIRNREPVHLLVGEERFIPQEGQPRLISYWLDEHENPVPTRMDWGK